MLCLQDIRYISRVLEFPWLESPFHMKCTERKKPYTSTVVWSFVAPILDSSSLLRDFSRSEDSRKVDVIFVACGSH